MDKPLVSVISCACNQGDWVRTTIPKMQESLGDWPHEIVIVDDQSTDGCCHGLPKDVLILRTETRHGVSASRRLGYAQAKGQILLFSDPHCDYPDHALADLVDCAWKRKAICMPKTVSLPTEKHPRFGGQLTLSDRGLKVSHSHKGVADWPALLGAIYAMNRVLYDHLGGWPELPGVWGYSEQALSLMAWFSGVPIFVDDRHVCNHQNYHPNGRFSYRVPLQDQANNGHWMHAGFFPKTYEKFWRPMLLKRFSSKESCWSCLGKDGWQSKLDGRRTLEKFRLEIMGRAVRTEEDFFRYILKQDVPSPEVEEWYLTQQRKRSKPVDDYDVVQRRQDRALRWFRDAIPGCLKQRKVLELGSRTGYLIKKLAEEHGAAPEGIELVPEVAEFARQHDLNVKTGDMRNLPYRDGEWHLVMSVHSLEHIPEPDVDKAISEMIRVLMPGGYALIAVPVEKTPSGRYAHNCCFPTPDDLWKRFEKQPVLKVKMEVKGLAPKPNEEILLAVRKKS